MRWQKVAAISIEGLRKVELADVYTGVLAAEGGHSCRDQRPARSAALMKHWRYP